MIAFVVEHWPSFQEILLGSPLSLLWAYVCLRTAGELKRRRGVRTGYTRKLFHFSILISAAGIQLIWDLGVLFVFGGATSLVIFYALWRGNGNVLYEAMARESDDPQRTRYILSPYFATLFGGLLSNALFGQVAVVGYLVTGFGDAIGEPVGLRFGKHRYRAPGFGPVRSTRSLEGSMAVLLVSGCAAAVGVALVPELSLGPASLAPLIGIALASALLEAISPHGWDNAVLQVVPSFLAWSWL